MTSTPSKKHVTNQVRSYERSESVVFLKTKESFGGLSNMAGGFPLRVNGILVLTTEALYQACRFPHLPDVQRLILGERSPMTAKMKSKPHRRNSRPDWDQVRVKIMRWCLRVKLAQNWRAFSELLLKTGERPIVEESRKDDFWGARPVGERTLVGMNVLGRLLMELREAVKAEDRDRLLRVEPIAISDFLLGGRPIETVLAQDSKATATMAQPVEIPSHGDAGSRDSTQPTFFDAPVVKEGVPPAYLDVSAKGVRIAELKPYQKYMSTAQAWLGEVPRHWSVVPNRALFSEVKERNHPDEEMLSVTITRGIIQQKVLLVGSSKKDSSNQDKSAYKLVQPRDLAYNKMRAWQGAIGASNLRGIISPAYVVMRLRRNDYQPRYFHHLYRTPRFAKEAERWSYGITSDMWSLRPEHFKMIYSPEPPPVEQAAIVRFLDWVNARLERTIRAKRKVIALLTEQKQAIVHRAVTRGLDLTVPVKPSGILGLSNIPAHWDVKRLKAIAAIRYGLGQPPRELEGGVPLIRATNVDHGGIVSKNLMRVDPSDVPRNRNAFLAEGEIVVVRSGAYTADSAIIPKEYEGAVAGYDMVVAVKKAVPTFIACALLCSYVRFDQLVIASMRAAQPHLNAEELGCALILLPPKDEQLEIVDHIQSESAPIHTAIARIEREIELLREYRTRLVADAVTGKLDVREVAHQLPEEGSELEPIGEIELDPEEARV
jgi:type I restriction enzyme S subunit